MGQKASTRKRGNDNALARVQEDIIAQNKEELEVSKEQLLRGSVKGSNKAKAHFNKTSNRVSKLRTSVSAKLVSRKSRSDADYDVWDQRMELAKLEKAVFGASGAAQTLGTTLTQRNIRDEASAKSPVSEDVRERVLSGHSIEEDLKIPPEIVRSFMSSTFTDTRSERDCFVAFCVPLLRSFCRDFGYEFELSEMRWGINSEISAQHQTSEICLRELQRCLTTSAAMHFVGILGDKYGFRPFPAEIEQSEFELLLDHCDADTDHDQLVEWFRLDTNKVPAVYRLRPVYEVIRGYSPEVQDAASQEWWSKCFEPMQHALRRCAENLHGNNIEARRPFEASVTELEMRLGFSHPGSVSLLISRHLEGEILHPGYRDTVDNAQDCLQHLRLWASDHASEVIEARVPWKENGIDPVTSKSHASYIKNILQKLCASYAQQITHLPAQEVEGSIFDEARAHARFASRKQKDFVGRHGLVMEVVNSVITQSACIVSGISGSGKTALAAQVLKLLPCQFNFVVRFIGTTSESSSLERLLYSVCEQISSIYGGSPPDPAASFDEICDAFKTDFMARGTKQSPLCIVFDSLDQLPVGSSLIWLPQATEVPEHCHILVTALVEGKGKPLERARAILQCKDISVPVIHLTDIDDVLDAWLSQEHRRDTEEQRLFCKDILSRAEEPTYLMLRTVFNQMTQWASYTSPPSTWAHVNDVVSLLETFFQDLEHKHGALFTEVALGLLTSARDGLSQPELEDLLSLDDRVLDVTFQWWVPPVPRIPPLVVTRLLADLEPFLVRKAGNTKAWFHRQFYEQALHRYAPRHAELAEYFGNQSIASEYTLSHPVGQQTILLSADRMTLSQPPWIGDGRPNIRVLRELIYQTRHSPPQVRQNLPELVFDFSFLSAAAHGSMLADVIDQLVLAKDDPIFGADIRQQLHVLCRCLLLSLPSVIRYAGCLVEQLWNRLADSSKEAAYLQRLLKTVASLREEALGSIMSYQPYLTPGDGDLMLSFTVHHKNPYFVRTVDAEHFVTGAADGELRIWEFRTGRLVQTLNKNSGPDIGGVTRLAVHRPVGSASNFIVSGFYGGMIRVWNAHSGVMIEDIQNAHKHWVYQVCPIRLGINDDENTRHPLPLIVSGSKATDVKVWHIPSISGHFQGDATLPCEQHELLHTLTDCISGVNSVDASYVDEECEPSFTKAPLIVAAGSNNDVRVWETSNVWEPKSFELIHVLGMGSKPYNGLHIFRPLGQSQRLIAAACEDMCVHLWDLGDGSHVRVFAGHSGDLRGLTIHTLSDLIGSYEVHTNGLPTEDSERLILFSSSDDNTCRAWDLDSGSTLRIFDAHARTCRTMALSCSLQSMVTCSFDNTVCVWDLSPATWNSPEVLTDGDLGYTQSRNSEVSHRTPQLGHSLMSKWAVSLAFRAEGVAEYRATCMTQAANMLLLGWTDGTVSIASESIGTDCSPIVKRRASITGIAPCFSNSGVVVAAQDGYLVVQEVCEVKGGKLRNNPSYTIKVHDDWINDVVVFKDHFAVTAGEDWSIRITSLLDQQLVAELKGHLGAVRSLVVSSDAQWLLSSSQDRQVILWDLEKLEKVQVLKGHNDWVLSIGFLPDGNAVSGAMNGELFWWLLNDAPCEPRTLRIAHAGYTSIAVKFDQSVFVTTLFDGSFEVWSCAVDNEPVMLATSLASLGHIDASPYLGQANCALIIEEFGRKSCQKQRSKRRRQVDFVVAFHNSGVGCFKVNLP